MPSSLYSWVALCATVVGIGAEPQSKMPTFHEPRLTMQEAPAVGLQVAAGVLNGESDQVPFGEHAKRAVPEVGAGVTPA